MIGWLLGRWLSGLVRRRKRPFRGTVRERLADGSVIVRRFAGGLGQVHAHIERPSRAERNGIKRP